MMNFFAALAVALLCLASNPAFAQYPAKPIHLMVPSLIHRLTVIRFWSESHLRYWACRRCEKTRPFVRSQTLRR